VITLPAFIDYIVPDFHVLLNGKIVKSGDASLALELEEKGYDWIKQEQSIILFKV
jgi:Fe-S cluster assembly ATP-binding protein